MLFIVAKKAELEAKLQQKNKSPLRKVEKKTEEQEVSNGIVV